MSNTADSFLSLQDRYIYRQLFLTADNEKKSFLLKSEAISFFSTAGIPSVLLEEIWKTVNQDKREFITELEFYKALKLIACAQNGIEAKDDILSTQAPIPRFGATMETIPPITANEREAYIQVFQSCNPINGLLCGQQAKDIFLRSNLPVDKLNAIWLLADTRHSGTLNKTEFIIAMHYISRLMKNPSFILPTSLPSQVYTEATGQFASSILRHNTMASPVAHNNRSLNYTSPIMSHTSRSPILNTTKHSISSQSTISIPPEETERYRAYFDQLDNDRSGFIDSEEAVYFFSHSRLPDSELGRIWEIADSKRLGKLDLHDFSIAMHLINMRKRGESIDRYESAPSHYHHQKQEQYAEASNLRYELENQIIEIKQLVNSEYKRAEDYRKQLQQEHQSIELLENEIVRIKAELETAKMAAEDAEKMLLKEQRHRESLDASPSCQTMNSTSTCTENAPELTRASSTFSGSSAMSPRSEFGVTALPSSTAFDSFTGFKRMNSDFSASPHGIGNLNNYNTTASKSQPSVSPIQSKAISKYGFDITAFDTLSINDSNEQSTGYTQKQSVKDDLVAIFGVTTDNPSPISSPPKPANTFDSIFL